MGVYYMTIFLNLLKKEYFHYFAVYFITNYVFLFIFN